MFCVYIMESWLVSFCLLGYPFCHFVTKAVQWTAPANWKLISNILYINRTPTSELMTVPFIRVRIPYSCNRHCNISFYKPWVLGQYLGQYFPVNMPEGLLQNCHIILLCPFISNFILIYSLVGWLVGFCFLHSPAGLKPHSYFLKTFWAS